jgi:hypothetical protein
MIRPRYCDEECSWRVEHRVTRLNAEQGHPQLLAAAGIAQGVADPLAVMQRPTAGAEGVDSDQGADGRYVR